MPFEGATATMKTAFATALVYWQDKKVDDAVKLAQDAMKHAGDLQAAANAAVNTLRMAISCRGSMP